MAYDPNEIRDERGRWGAGGAEDRGGPTTPAQSGARPTPEYIRERADAIAKEMKFDPKRIDISDESKTFVLNGVTMHYAGSADITPNGRVTIYTNHVTAASVDGVLAHEIEHMKFQSVLDRYTAESTAVGKEPGPAPDPESKYYWSRNGGPDAVMAPDGRLRGDYAAKYPVYSAMQEALYTKNMSEFGKTDGVSPYSFDWWKAYQANGATAYQAIHETLAEMARAKQETGKFPEHMGPRVLSYRGDGPALTKTAIAEGTKMWRNLYTTVKRLAK
jgi:hypothetical protein